ncbi:hypothetical protein CH341_11640 [Rhodoplanes roseus]|uniref:Globin domain-containing protein n=2 Tax=Rhodoplanes roseus TaxID=29409 RepID=A0A327L1V9_9BRAD|nr:hypothetical protein CH341_11640 [Rhodoplanes roseus]
MQILSPEDIEHVRSSFDRVWAESRRLTDLFYGRLFETAPDVQPLFRGNIDEQKQKFLGTLAVIVGSLENAAVLMPAAATLARQHVDYGVSREHYPVVGEALLWSMERCLGSDWTPSVAAAWRRAYAAITDHMIASAYTAEDAAGSLTRG